MNKTPLSAKTNRQIGGNAPSLYLGKIQKASGIAADRMDEILESHLIDPETIREDQFAAFFGNRSKAILDRIEAAMGKQVMGRDLTMQEESQNGDEDEPDIPES